MAVRQSLAVQLGGNAGFFVIGFAASIMLARLLTPAEMGVYAAALAIVYILNAVTNVGLSGYLVRERELTPAKIGGVFTMALIQAAVLSAALFALSWPIGAFARDARVTESVQILCLFAAMQPVTSALNGLLQRDMRFGRYTAIGLTNVVVSSAATIALALDGWGYRAPPWGTVAGAAAALLFTLWVQRRAIRVPLTLAYAGPIYRYGVKILSAGLIVNITGRMPDLLLTRFSGAAATGLYNRGAGLVDVFTNTILRSFQRVMGSQFARDRDTPQGIGPAYARMSRVVTGLFWPAFAVLAVLASPLIDLLYGPQWLAAAPVLALIAGAASIALMVACRSEVLITMGREGELPRIELIRGVIGVTLFAIGAQFGLVWAAATRLVDAALAVVLYSPGIHAATGLSWRAVAGAMARSALVAGLAAGPALGWMAWRGWPSTLPWVELLAVLTACGAVWLAALFATRHTLAQELARAGRLLRAKVGR